MKYYVLVMCLISAVGDSALSEDRVVRLASTWRLRIVWWQTDARVRAARQIWRAHCDTAQQHAMSVSVRTHCVLMSFRACVGKVVAHAIQSSLICSSLVEAPLRDGVFCNVEASAMPKPELVVRFVKYTVSCQDLVTRWSVIQNLCGGFVQAFWFPPPMKASSQYDLCHRWYTSVAWKSLV